MLGDAVGGNGVSVEELVGEAEGASDVGSMVCPVGSPLGSLVCSGTRKGVDGVISGSAEVLTGDEGKTEGISVGLCSWA